MHCEQAAIEAVKMLSKLSKIAFHQSFVLNGLILRSACATQTLQFHRNLFLTQNCSNKVLQNMPDLQGTRPTEHNQKSEKKKSKWLRRVLAFGGALGLGLFYGNFFLYIGSCSEFNNFA